MSEREAGEREAPKLPARKPQPGAAKRPREYTAHPAKHGLWIDFKAAKIDGRTGLGKAIRLMRAELIRHVGGRPTIAQKILIDRITHKTIKAHLYEMGVLQEDQGSKPHYLALVNSLRLDLQALGLKGSGEKILDLNEYLKNKSALNAEKGDAE
jgi:hypothetical protein